MELKELSDTIQKDWAEFKKVNETRLKEIAEKGVTSAQVDEKLAKIEERITASEKKQRDLIADLEARARAPEGGIPGGKMDEKALKRKSAFNAYLRKGEKFLNSEQLTELTRPETEQKAMIASNDATGGYLVPEDMERSIIKGIIESSPVRSIARIRPTTGDTSRHPKRTGTFAAVWVHEQGTRSETTGLTYGIEEIPNHELTAMVDISQRDLEDSAFDLENELGMEFSEQFAVAEGTAFVKGHGAGQPEGILTASSSGVLPVQYKQTTGASNVLAADDLVDAFYMLKDGYARNARWLIKRGQIGKIRKLKGSDNNYLWQPGLSTLSPNTILGAPYDEAVDLDTDGSTLKKIAILGDFRRGYVISDRIGISLMRDPYTQASTGKVRFWARRRVGGQVVLGEAFVVIKTPDA